MADGDTNVSDDVDCDPFDFLYVGREDLTCDTCDSLAMSVNPLYRKPIKSKLRKQKWRPWKQRRGGAPDGRSCYFCVVGARKFLKACGGVKGLSDVRKDQVKKSNFKAAISKLGA